MALNKVESDGHISNIGPCWFFPAATSVVFDLDEEMGGATAASPNDMASQSGALPECLGCPLPGRRMEDVSGGDGFFISGRLRPALGG
ncbi:hypothetical protein [Streptomyces xiaopingdaonensis]|uniref:hypothetical protein n=1 Tax=Streptomyces xiaopingdaonensis TaxID=1565415 RepID=UPI0002D8B699|nr:hypothetical protein [Streptomyces xiaopingdaonensis]